jgi:transcriptional regulator with XRE-family HTH domain
MVMAKAGTTKTTTRTRFQLSAAEVGTFAGRLARAREALGLTQQALSERSGIPLSTLKKYEGSHREPGTTALAQLVAVGINVNWLLTGDGPPMLLAEMQAGRGFADAGLLRAVVAAVEECLAAAGAELAPGKRADLVVTAYEMSVKEGALIAPDWVSRLVRLALSGG